MGSEGKIFYAHPGVFAPFPKSALYAQINGSWKGKSDGILDLTEFDEHTIECFLSYFYRRDYCPYHVTPKPDLEVGHEIKAEDNADTDSPLIPLDRMPELRPIPTSKKKDPSENSHEELVTEALVHARVYSFAHLYLFPELETFALHRLGKIIIALQLHKVNMPLQLADAVRVIYSSTPVASYNPARELLSRFIALNFRTLVGECLDQLMQEGGDFAVDVSRKLARDCPPELRRVETSQQTSNSQPVSNSSVFSNSQPASTNLQFSYSGFGTSNQPSRGFGAM